MARKQSKALKARDPFDGIPFGVNALIRNEGSTIEEVPIDEIDVNDELWRLRPAAHLELLVESIQLAGQRSPVVLRFEETANRWQIISGFRRVEALRQMGRTGVTARLFDNLSSEDAIKIAICDNFFSGDLTGDHIDELMERLRNESLLGSAGLEFLDWARERIARVTLGSATESSSADAAAEDGEEEVSILIDQTFVSLSEAAQGLERIFLNWSDISEADRRLLASECKYIHDLYPFLTR